MIKTSAAEIARQEKCTRANISQKLKSALRKVYRNILEENLVEGPYEAFNYMVDFFNLQQQDDINEFYKTLPKKIKEEIKEDAKACHL